MEAQTRSEQSSLSHRLTSIAESVIVDSRWLLYPITVGILVALAIYTLAFLREEYHLIANSFHLGGEEMMVVLLGLVDMYMVANLLVMIAKGSYHIFIQRIQGGDPAKRPQWLDHVDSGILKVKVASSIAGITLIRLLKDFVNIEHVPWDLIVHRMYIHGLCLISALMMALIWRVTHPTNGNH